jgi:predicted RNA-binding protein associated with RNAse of E/G family
VSLGRRVHIHYLRPPERLQVFEQRLILDGADVKVTLAEAMPFDPPMRIDGDVVLEHGSDVVWFTFPGLWHDIGRFHRADGTFTGIYANILTPPEMRDGEWHTTDLYLDVWLAPGGTPRLLDEDELDEALGREWIDVDTARRARDEAGRLVEAARAGAWPPPVVREWTLERCRAELERASA